MAKATHATNRGVEVIDHNKRGLNNRSDHELSNPHTALNAEGGVTSVEEDGLNFAPVVGVDGPGGVEEPDPLLEGKAASRPNLGFKTGRKGNLNPCWNQDSFSGKEFGGLRDSGEKVKPARPFAHITRKWESLVMGKTADLYFALEHLTRRDRNGDGGDARDDGRRGIFLDPTLDALLDEKALAVLGEREGLLHL